RPVAGRHHGLRDHGRPPGDDHRRDRLPGADGLPGARRPVLQPAGRRRRRRGHLLLRARRGLRSDLVRHLHHQVGIWMITTGTKLYAGYLAAALLGAVVYGYTTGGNHVGPLTLGYKGSVGDHFGYGILLGLAVACALMTI